MISEVPNSEEELIDELARTVIKGNDYEAFFNSKSYRRVLDWLESKADGILAAMRSSSDLPDRSRLDMIVKWGTTEDILKELQVEVQQSIVDRDNILGMKTGENNET